MSSNFASFKGQRNIDEGNSPDIVRINTALYNFIIGLLKYIITHEGLYLSWGQMSRANLLYIIWVLISYITRVFRHCIILSECKLFSVEYCKREVSCATVVYLYCLFFIAFDMKECMETEE
jgi:hypothetical protein